MNILVLGATGFIGQAVVQRLTGNHHVFAVGRRITNSSAEKRNLKYIQADISHDDFCSHLPTDIDCVVHLAQSDDYRKFPEKAEEIFKVNVEAVQKLCEWARRNRIKHLIYTSSANVYQQLNRPIQETDPLTSTSFYAASKRMAEEIIGQYKGYFTTTILRLFTVYGPNQEGMLIPNLIQKISSGEPVQIYGQQGISLSPIYVLDVAKCIEKVLLSDQSETYNLGGQHQTSILRLSELIADICNIKLKTEYCPSDDKDNVGWVADTNKFLQDFGEVAGLELRQGIENTVAAFKEKLMLRSECLS